jgi:hypothetical protein
VMYFPAGGAAGASRESTLGSWKRRNLLHVRCGKYVRDRERK